MRPESNGRPNKLAFAVVTVGGLMLAGICISYWISAARAVHDISIDGVRTVGRITQVFRQGEKGQSVTYSFPCGSGFTCSGVEEGNHYKGPNQVGDTVGVLYSRRRPSECTLDWPYLQNRPRQMEIALGLSLLLMVLPVTSLAGITMAGRRYLR